MHAINTLQQAVWTLETRRQHQLHAQLRQFAALCRAKMCGWGQLGVPCRLLSAVGGLHLIRKYTSWRKSYVCCNCVVEKELTHAGRYCERKEEEVGTRSSRVSVWFSRVSPPTCSDGLTKAQCFEAWKSLSKGRHHLLHKDGYSL